uniref:Uncharacterized protein n=1 Tax=Arundo donax TaxID=35708 RepID=A0A0A9CTM9_ARUDO
MMRQTAHLSEAQRLDEEDPPAPAPAPAPVPSAHEMVAPWKRSSSLPSARQRACFLGSLLALSFTASRYSSKRDSVRCVLCTLNTRSIRTQLLSDLSRLVRQIISTIFRDESPSTSSVTACLERWCASSASHLPNCSPHLWQLSPPEPLPPPPVLAVISSHDAGWPDDTTEPFLSSSTFGDLGGVQRTLLPPRHEPLYCSPWPAHAGPGVPGRSVPTNDDTTTPPPSASCAAPAAPWPPQPPKPVILSSQRELVLSTTSWAMGLRNSLLPMDRGLQLGG